MMRPCLVDLHPISLAPHLVDSGRPALPLGQHRRLHRALHLPDAGSTPRGRSATVAQPTLTTLTTGSSAIDKVDNISLTPAAHPAGAQLAAATTTRRSRRFQQMRAG